MNKLKILTGLIAVSILLGVESGKYYLHYHLEDTKAHVPEISLDFDRFQQLIPNLTAGQSIYLRLSEQHSTKHVITWDAKTLEKMKISTFQSRDDNPNEFDKIKLYKSFGGSAAEAIKGRLNVHNKQNDAVYLEIELDGLIADGAVLRIFDLPIKLVGKETCMVNFQVAFGSRIIYQENEDPAEYLNRLAWHDLNLGMVVTDPEIELEKEYKFNDVEDDIFFNFNLNCQGPLAFTADRRFEIILDEPYQWGTDFDKLSVIAGQKELSASNYFVGVEGGNLVFIPAGNLEVEQLHFENIPLQSVGRKGKIVLKATAEYSPNTLQDEKTPSFLGRIISLLFQRGSRTGRSENSNLGIRPSKNIIRILDIDIGFYPYEHQDFSYLLAKLDDKAMIKLPEMVILPNGADILTSGLKVIIKIPEEIPVSFFKYSQVNEIPEADIKVFDKKTEIILISNIASLDRLLIPSLQLNNPGKPVEEFRFHVYISALDNADQIASKDAISIGLLNWELTQDQILFVSEEQPVISQLELYSDGISSQLNNGDLLEFDLSMTRNLRFVENQELSISNPEYFEFNVTPTVMTLKVIKNIPPDAHIYISDLKVQAKGTSQTIHPVFRLEPEQYFNYRRGKPQSNLSKIYVYDFNVNIEQNSEYIPDIQKVSNKFDLPDIHLTNDSSIPITNISEVVISLPGGKLVSESGGIIANTSYRERTKPKVSLDSGKIALKFDREILSNEMITIEDLALVFDESDFPFRQKNLKIEFNFNSRDLQIPSKNTITYGSPFIQSKDDQNLLRNTVIIPAFEVYVDLSAVPDAAVSWTEVGFFIPADRNLSWSESHRHLLIESADRLFSSEVTVSVTADGKGLLIPLHSIPEKYRQKWYISGMFFSRVGAGQDGINLLFSADRGKTFYASDTKIKSVISESNSLMVIRKMLNESWFPFKKGNNLVFVIAEDSQFAWDYTQVKDLYHKHSEINANSRMLGIPLITDDGKRIQFPIQHDLNDVIYGAQLMDFGRQLILNLKTVDTGGSSEKPEIKLGIDTIYGKRYINSAEINELIEFRHMKSVNNISTVAIKLNYGEIDDEAVVQWYRHPANLLALSGINNRSISDENRDQNLEKMKDLLEDFANKYFDRYARYDWLFWYYLALYKAEITQIKHEGYKIEFNPDRLSDTMIWEDLAEAESKGYSSRYYSIWPPPNSTEMNIVNPTEILEEILALVDSGEYNKGYERLFQELHITMDLRDDSWVEAVSLYLEAILSNCARNDASILRNDQTYPEALVYEAQFTLLNHKEIRNQFDNWIRNTDSDIFGNCFSLESYGINCEGTNFEPDSEIVDLSDFDTPAELDLVRLRFSWRDADKAEKYEWKMYVSNDPESVGHLPIIGMTNTNQIAFGDEIDINGGEQYELDFEPVNENKTRLISTLLLSLPFILILL